MNELKPGDKVFVGPWFLIDDGEAYQILGEGHFIGDVLMAPPEKDAAPYTDNLAAVARVLAAHPDGFMALGRVVSNIESDQNGESEGVWGYNDAELGFLRALAAALNGGTE